MNLKEQARKLKQQIPAVFLALKDPETPAPAKIAAALTVAYALSPVDLIPDFIPVLGYLDDILLLPALAALTIRLIPPPGCGSAAFGILKICGPPAGRKSGITPSRSF